VNFGQFLWESQQLTSLQSIEELPIMKNALFVVAILANRAFAQPNPALARRHLKRSDVLIYTVQKQ
jgi:hypothetical protein